MNFIKSFFILAFLSSPVFATTIPLTGVGKTPSLSFSCTGGTISSSGGKTIHTFTASGTLTCSGTSTSANYLVVGAAGGSGCTRYTSAAGASGSGGGGGVFSGSTTLAAGSYTITVGTAGVRCIGASQNPTSGTGSKFDTIASCDGGGAGGYYNGSSWVSAASGQTGIGGGASGGGSAISGSAGTASAGSCLKNNGASGTSNGNSGGGSGSVGNVAVAPNGAAGANGFSSNISGSTVFYGCSGGSGAYQAGTPGAAGCATAGAGSVDGGTGGNATANSGSSGGSGGGTFSGTASSAGTSADGVVIVAY